MRREFRIVDGLKLPEMQLKKFLKGRVCLLGIGNRAWRDDGVGSIIAEVLEPTTEFAVIDAGFVPENHLERVARRKPDTILMIDATDFGGKPGQVCLLDPHHVAWSGLSTHAGSLQMLAAYLQARTQAQVALLAIQPADTSAGQGLSSELSQTATTLQQVLPKLINSSHVGGRHAAEKIF